MVSWRDKLDNLRSAARDLKERAQDFLNEHEEQVRKLKPFLIVVPLLLLGLWIGGQVVREVREETEEQAAVEIVPDGGLEPVPFAQNEEPLPRGRAHPNPAALEAQADAVPATGPAPPSADPPDLRSTPSDGPPEPPAPNAGPPNRPSAGPPEPPVPSAGPAEPPVPSASLPDPPVLSARQADPERSTQAEKPALADEGRQAHAAVTDFYNSVNQREFGPAYDHLSPDWQRELPFNAFAGGYAATDQVFCRVDNVSLLTGHRARVDVRLDVLENGARTEYLATYLLIQTRDGWRLDRGRQFRT